MSEWYYVELLLIDWPQGRLKRPFQSQKFFSSLSFWQSLIRDFKRSQNLNWSQELWKIAKQPSINKQGGITSGLFKAGVQHPDDRPETDDEANDDRNDYSWRTWPDYEVYTHHATRNFKPYLLNGLDPRVAQSWLPPGENNEKEIEIYQVTDVQSVWQSEQSDVDRNGGKELSIWRTQAKNGFYSIGSVISRSKTKIGAGILLKVKKEIQDAVRDPMFYTALNTGKARVRIFINNC